MSAYRGADRRGIVRAGATPPWWLASAAAMMAAAVVVDAAGITPVADDVLRGVGAGLALAAAAVYGLRWWSLGDTVALWLAGALLPTAGALLATGPGTAWQLAGALTAVVACTVPEVDARQRRWWLVLGPTAVALVLTVLTSLPAVVAAAGWVLASATLLVQGARSRRSLLVWFAVGGVGLAATNVLDGDVTTAAALGAMLVGPLLGLRGAIALQRDRLLGAAMDSRHTAARSDAASYARERTTHDAHNVLTAITGAVSLLDRHRDRLDPRTRDELSASLQREMKRLHGLLEPDAHDALETFNVMSALRPLRAWGPQDVHWEIAEDLTAYGRVGDTGQAMRLLLEGTQHAAPVTVRGSRRGDRLHIEVTGVRIEGLNEQVAAALMAAQQGRLVPAEGTSGPGYVLELPAGASG